MLVKNLYIAPHNCRKIFGKENAWPLWLKKPCGSVPEVFWLNQSNVLRHAALIDIVPISQSLKSRPWYAFPDNALDTKMPIKSDLEHQLPTRLINKTPTGLLLILRTGSVVGPKATVSIPKLSLTTARARIFIPTRG